MLCCDNLPENGALLRAGVLYFAGRTGVPGLARWIEDDVAAELGCRACNGRG